MTPEDAIQKMIPPGQLRSKKATKGVIQIHITRACDLSCAFCTQGSQLRGPYYFMSPEDFETACKSLKDYPYVVGMFGGNCCLSPSFPIYCEILAAYIPKERCGLWSNNLNGHGAICRKTFNPSVSNLNVHMRLAAYQEMKRDWPESMPFGLRDDSRHSPTHGSAQELADIGEGEMWEKISGCPINRFWSAGIASWRGKVMGWFCEIAMSQSILFEHDVDYPETGIDVAQDPGWWKRPIEDFEQQIRQHCPNCLVPLQGYGALSQTDNATEQTTEGYREVYLPKRKNRQVQFVTLNSELESKNLLFTDYLGGGRK